MASWSEFASQAPALAEAVETALGAHKHKMLATLRRDGSPRLSGIEVDISEGELWFGMMPDSMKGADLRRDARFALHSAPVDLELTHGDAKLNGRAILDEDAIEALRKRLTDAGTPPPPGPMDLFRADLTDASIVRVEGNELVIDSWRDGEPPKRRRRD
jgi:hypothetical protein